MEKLKSYLHELGLFLSSRIFLSNFAKMAGVVIVLFFLCNWWLRCYTKHGESVQVDDFTGMHVSDARKQSDDKGFRFEVIDSAWMAGKPSGLILNQIPKPLSRVKEGRMIYVTITGNPKSVYLPELAESSYDFEQYSKRLADRFQITSSVKERVYDRKQAENTILYFYYKDEKITDQDIKRGYKVPEGSNLEFVITERRTNEMNVPDLVCMTYSAADFLVSSFNLNIGNVFEDISVTDRESAYVYRQDPPYDPDRIVQMGAQINIWLTQERPVNCQDNE